MVQVYLGDGGNLSTASTVQDVLDKLKRSRPTSEVIATAAPGTGRLIDVRLVATMGSSSGESLVAAWNPVEKKFVVGAGAGASSFELDNSLTLEDFPTESREAHPVSFNSSKGWIWGNTVAASAPDAPNATRLGGSGGGSPFDPDAPYNPVGTGTSTAASTSTSSSTSSSTSTSTSISTSVGVTSATTGPTIQPLPPPVISPGGGTYPSAAFPSSASIANGGATGPYQTRYRINGGAWVPGGSVPLTSGTRIDARNFSTDTNLASDSPIVSADFYRTVDGFQGSASGSWNSPSGGDPSKYVTDNTSATTTFKHGNTQLNLGNGVIEDSGTPNVLAFKKNNFSGVPPNTSFKLGDVNFTNGVTFNDSEASSVTLTINLDFSTPPIQRNIDVRLNLINTANNGDRMANADIVELASPSPLNFDYDNVNYTLQLEWVTLDPSKGAVQGSRFLIFEGAAARGELRGKLVPNH